MNELSFNKLNMGGSLTALLHAYVTETPIIIDIPHLPFELDECPDHWDLSFLGFSNQTTVTKLHVWERLTFLLSMAGLVVFPSSIKNAHQEQDGLVLVLSGNKRYKVKYKELHSFDKDKEEYIMTYDWFDAKVGATHAHEVLYDDDKFCSKVIFYPSRRIGTKNSVKDICVISKIPSHLIDEIDYSPIYARLKTLSMMKTAGIKGKINGYNKHGTPTHLSLKIEHSHRETTQITTNKMKVEDLLDKRPNKHGDLWKLTQRFSLLKTHSTLQELSQ
jgi:hypothetical protein